MTTATRATTIDITPTWSDLLPAMLAVVSNPKASKEARTTMYDELAKMARAADAMVKIQQTR